MSQVGAQYARREDDVGPQFDAAHATQEHTDRGSYPYAVIVVLLLTNAFNFIDRQLPYILAEAIRHEFGLNDTQLGILNGAAFAIVYAVMAIPLARAADRWGSRWVLSGCLFIWSAMTCLGGLARSFWQLSATRFGVALGEAGSSPLSHSVISNYFPPHKRSTPLGLSSLGMSVGSMLGLVLGGWLGEVVGWRNAFMLCGVPGILLAIAAAFVIREPNRVRSQATPLSLIATGKHLFAHAWYRHIFCAITVLSMGIYATLTFTPPFLMRVFGMNYQAAGLSLGLVYGVAGIAGALIGGWLGDRLVSRDRRWRLWLPGLGFAVAAPCMVAACFAPTSLISVLFMMAPKFANLLYVVPTFALVQSQVPVQMRATSSAVIYFGMGLIGLSLGPLFVGVLSDYLQPLMGTQSLRYALLFVAVTQVWGATHYMLAARALPK